MSDDDDDDEEGFDNFDDDEDFNLEYADDDVDPIEEYPDELNELAVAEENAGAHNVSDIPPVVAAKNVPLNPDKERAKTDTLFATADYDEFLGEDFEKTRWVAPSVQKVS